MRPSPSQLGFTLIELMVVVAIVAIGSAVASLALRDPSSTQAEREAARLSALVDAARMEGRASGLAVFLVAKQRSDSSPCRDFYFEGLPKGGESTFGNIPDKLMDPRACVDIYVQGRQAYRMALGPEPIIEPAKIVVSVEQARSDMSTDGISSFGNEDDRVAERR